MVNEQCAKYCGKARKRRAGAVPCSYYDSQVRLSPRCSSGLKLPVNGAVDPRHFRNDQPMRSFVAGSRKAVSSEFQRLQLKCLLFMQRWRVMPILVQPDFCETRCSPVHGGNTFSATRRAQRSENPAVAARRKHLNSKQYFKRFEAFQNQKFAARFWLGDESSELASSRGGAERAFSGPVFQTSEDSLYLQTRQSGTLRSVQRRLYIYIPTRSLIRTCLWEQE